MSKAKWIPTVLFSIMGLAHLGCSKSTDPLPTEPQPPELATIDAKSINEGQTLTFGVSASDPNRDPLVLTAESVPANATFTDNSDGTGIFEFTPAYNQAGIYTIRFIASDGELADTEIVAITVIDEPGEAVQYFPLNVGFDAQYKLSNAIGEEIGTTRFAIVDEFTDGELSGFVAVDSIPQWLSPTNWLDTLWIITSGDTVFYLEPGQLYQQRQPLVRNRTFTYWAWPLYSVGSPGTSGRYTVFFHQRAETETVVLTTGDIFTDCGRTDRLAVYELSGDTVVLGSEYFAPDIGRVLSSFRPFVESAIYYRELIR